MADDEDEDEDEEEEGGGGGGREDDDDDAVVPFLPKEDRKATRASTESTAATKRRFSRNKNSAQNGFFESLLPLVKPPLDLKPKECSLALVARFMLPFIASDDVVDIDEEVAEKEAEEEEAAAPPGLAMDLLSPCTRRGYEQSARAKPTRRFSSSNSTE